MSATQTIDEHMVIRETVGYEGIKDVELHDLPQVLDFLKIVRNYLRMTRIIEDEHICTRPGPTKMR